MEADAVMINEHRMNCSHKDNRNVLSQMFNGGECEIRSMAGHNVHKKKGSPQQIRDQQRASVFRTRQETSRVTKLLDSHGNKRVIRQHGKMGLIKHVNILAVL